MKQVTGVESDRRSLGAGIRLLMTIVLFALMAGSAAAATKTITLRVDKMS